MVATQEDILSYLKARFRIPADREIQINWDSVAHYFRHRHGHIEVEYRDDGDGWQPVPMWRVLDENGCVDRHNVAPWVVEKEGHELEEDLRVKGWEQKRFKFPIFDV